MALIDGLVSAGAGCASSIGSRHCAGWTPISSYPSAEALRVSLTMTPALATSPRNGRAAPVSRSSFAVSAAARTSASRARSQPIARTVAPAARASSATCVRTSPALPTSSRSGLSGAGRLAIAEAAARPSPPVGPVISTVPGLVVVIVLPPLSYTWGCRLPRDWAAGGHEGPGRSVRADLRHADDDLGTRFDALRADAAIEVPGDECRGHQVTSPARRRPPGTCR